MEHQPGEFVNGNPGDEERIYDSGEEELFNDGNVAVPDPADHGPNLARDANDEDRIYDSGEDEFFINDNVEVPGLADREPYLAGDFGEEDPIYDSGEDEFFNPVPHEQEHEIIYDSDEDLQPFFHGDDEGDEDDEDDEVYNDGEFQDFFHINVEGDGLGELLHPEGNLFKWEKLLLEIAAALRFKTSYKSMLASFKRANMEFDNADFPTTMRAFWRIVNRNLDNFRHSIVCTVCWDDLGNGKIPNRVCRCGRTGPGLRRTELGTFLYLNLPAQLQGLLKKPGIATDLEYPWTREKRDPDAMEDVYDGSVYQHLSANGEFLSQGNHNYSLAIWADGIDPVPSNPVTVWPVFAQVLELSPRARQRNSLLAALFVGPRKPHMAKFLTPVAMELRTLRVDGLRWNPNGGPEIVSKFTTLIVSADSEARYLILGMMRHNAFSGCTFCYARGERAGDRHRLHLFRYNDGNPDNQEVFAADRTNEEIRGDAALASENNRPVNGVREISALSIIPGFDLRKCQIVEALHCLFERNLPRLYELMTNANIDDYITPREIRTISSRIELVKPPTKLARQPRPLERFAKFKGTEYRNLTWYYWLPCAHDFMGNERTQHFALFAEATYIMSKDSILPGELDRVEAMIDRFRQQSEVMFPESSLKYSLHLLKHIVRCVRELGPLWVASGFWFESLNRQIKNYLTSPTDRAFQIACRVLLAQMVEKCMEWPMAPRVANELREYLHKARWIELPNLATGRFIRHDRGTPGMLEPEEIAAFGEAGYPDMNEESPITRHLRVVIDGVTYQPKSVRAVQYDNSVISIIPSDGENRIEFIRIKSILTWPGENTVMRGVIGASFITLEPAFNTSYMRIVEETQNLLYLPLTSIKSPAVLVESGGRIYVSPIPNRWDVD